MDRWVILKSKKRLMAVCGLDCGDCDIFRVPLDPQAASRVTAWFREMGWLEEGEDASDVVERAPYCEGCRGDRTVHWSPDCWILKCCVDDKGREFCYECEGFPCEELLHRAKGNERYRGALELLKKMKEETT